VIHKPELLFLDEPTSAVDPESRRDFWEKLFDLADAGTTLLVSTHYMDEAERCHRIAILDRGRLVADGSPHELTARARRAHASRARAEPRACRATGAGGLDGVLSVAQIGNQLRVLVRPASRCRASLRRHCARPADRGADVAGIDAEPRGRVRLRHPRREGCNAEGRMKWARLWAVMLKELRQMRRDRVTLAMIVGIPVLQLLLFGYAINMNLRGPGRGIADRPTARVRALW
jgi:hypothetical protein